MGSILNMGKEEILEIEPRKINRVTTEEILHIFQTLGGAWHYNYEAAYKGRLGYHPLSGSGKHRDGFLNSHIVLEKENLRQLFAQQIARILQEQIGFLRFSLPQITGVPTGATELGGNIASTMDLKQIQMKKREGEIEIEKESVDPSLSALLVEDLCTTDTEFAKAVSVLKSNFSHLRILPYAPVIINQEKESIIDTSYGSFMVLPLVDHRINEWEAKNCPLCKLGSQAINPEESQKNWELLINSQ